MNANASAPTVAKDKTVLTFAWCPHCAIATDHKRELGERVVKCQACGCRHSGGKCMGPSRCALECGVRSEVKTSS